MRASMLIATVALLSCSAGSEGSSSEALVETPLAASTPTVDAPLPGRPPTRGTNADALALIRRGAHVAWALPRTVAGADARSAIDAAAVDARVARSYVLDPNGNVIGELPFAVVGGGGRVFRWQIEQRAVVRTPCESEPVAPSEESPADIADMIRERYESERADLAANPTRNVDEASLVDLATGEKITIAQAPEDGAQDIQFLVGLDRSFGGRAFVHEYEWAYTCGAHGNYGTQARVIDLATLRDVDLKSELDADLTEHARGAAKRTLATMYATERLDEGADPPELVELLPRLDAKRGIVFDARFLIGAPYAFSTGWVGYGMDAVVELARPPSSFSAPAHAPESVVAFGAAHPELVIGGYF